MAMSTPPASDDGARVLIIDDHPSARALIAGVLRVTGVKSICFASDGSEGLEILAGWAPDAIVVDLQMTPMNGIELTREVRAHPNGQIATVPIIMVTARTDAATVLCAKEAGVDEFVAKPITVRGLTARFERAVHGRSVARLFDVGNTEGDVPTLDRPQRER